MDQWITIKDASVMLGQSVSVVRKMIKKDPSIQTKLENSPNGGFKMYLEKDTLVKSFSENDAVASLLNGVVTSLSDDLDLGNASAAPSQAMELGVTASQSNRQRLDDLKETNTELRIELERWKCRSEEYKNRFEHELLERYRERKIHVEQAETKDALLEQLNLRMKDSSTLLLAEQKNIVELNNRFTPPENDAASSKSPLSLSWDLAMIVGSVLLCALLIGAFAYILA